MMNIKELKEMISLMDEHGLMELELEREGLRIKLKKHPAGVVSEIIAQPRPGEDFLRAGETKPQEDVGKLIQIKAPMVGTFYRSPSPESAPFADAGQAIEVGQVICIIEAMKLMNEIKSEVKGRVREVLVENGSPVEFGQLLFLVEPH